MPATVVLLPVLLASCSFAPGFLVVRRFPWNPLEKFCAAIAASLVVLYLAAGSLYVLHVSDWRIPCLVISALSLGSILAMHRDIRRIVSSRSVRRPLLGFLFLFAWMLSIDAIIRVLSGGGWANDWLEHFQRVLFFLRGFPPSTPVWEHYILPARPPLANLVGAFFLAQVGERFEYHQVIFLFLNSLFFLPCCLMAPLLAPRGRWRIVPVAALIALCPMVIANVTSPITKLVVAFYVVLALRFYITGWRRQDTVRTTAAFLCLAGAMLAHYSAGPYLAFVAIHFTVVQIRRRRIRPLFAAALPAAALLATWFCWSIATYGVGRTFGSNTTVTATKQAEGSNLAKISANFFDTIVPHPFRDDASMEIFAQASALGYFRDYVFLINQTNLIFAMGVVGGPLALLLLFRNFRRLHDPGRRSLRFFWLGFITFVAIVGVAVHGERDLFGVAHVTLQSLIVLGLTWLAASFPSMPRVAAGLLVLGCTLDFAIGMAPEIWAEHIDNTPQQTVFYDPVTQFATNGPNPRPEFYLSRSTWSNWFGKHLLAVCTDGLKKLQSGDFPTRVAASYRAQLQDCQMQDIRYWRGWYARHDGSITYLGDWVATQPLGGAALPIFLVIAGFSAMIVALFQAIPPPLRTRPAPAKPRAKPKRRK